MTQQNDTKPLFYLFYFTGFGEISFFPKELTKRLGRYLDKQHIPHRLSHLASN